MDWQIQPPGSKSITNRALLLAAVARGRTRLVGGLEAEDTALMRAALRAYGLTVDVDASGETTVDGAAGPLPVITPAPEIFVGTAGTVARFLLAVAAASPGAARLDGTPRMRERPMGLLVEMLRAQGARIVDEGLPTHLPLRIEPNPAGLRGGEIRLPRPASSQFVSGLVFAAALARGETRIVLEQGTPARPYVDMTLAILCAFGGEAAWIDDAVLRVAPRPLVGGLYRVEPDASAASYPLALAAIYGGRASIRDLGSTSLQGDVGFAAVLGRMGAHVEQTPDTTTVLGTGTLVGGDFDLSDMPDMTLTLAVTALFARGPTRITGVGILRHHESDRLAAAATELRKLGATVHELEDGLAIEPPAQPRGGAVIETYHDHRMAMAFSLAGEVVIRDPGCVAKTYPDYFQHLDRIGMVVRTE